MVLLHPSCVYYVYAVYVIKESKTPEDEPLTTERDDDSSLSAEEDKTVVDAVEDRIEDLLSNLRLSLLLPPLLTPAA